MITVGFDVTPLHTGHKVRGIGFYTKRLLKALENLDKDIKVRGLKSAQEINRQDYDLLHIPYFDPYFRTLPWPWKINKPLIVTIHDMIPVKYPQQYPAGVKGNLNWQFQKLLLKQVDFIITDSFASKYDIADLTGYSADRIYVTHLAAGKQFKQLPANSSKLKAGKEKYNLPEQFCLYVGDVNWNKNIPSLVNACEKINLPLVIAGKQAVEPNFDHNHPENQDLVWLQQKAAKSKLVNLTGFVSIEDLVALYNLAVVYVQPSFDEGFGLPVLEAMACGCPVISSNYGSLPEVVGDAGIKVKPSSDSLAEAIEAVVKDRKKQQELSQKGLKRANKFSWDKTAQKTSQVYKLAMT